MTSAAFTAPFESPTQAPPAAESPRIARHPFTAAPAASPAHRGGPGPRVALGTAGRRSGRVRDAATAHLPLGHRGDGAGESRVPEGRGAPRAFAKLSSLTTAAPPAARAARTRGGGGGRTGWNRIGSPPPPPLRVSQPRAPPPRLPGRPSPSPPPSGCGVHRYAARSLSR